MQVGRCGRQTFTPRIASKTLARALSRAALAEFWRQYCHVPLWTSTLDQDFELAISSLGQTVANLYFASVTIPFKGRRHGGVTGLGLGLNTSTAAKRHFNQGINTGGVQGSAIGAGTGRINDLDRLGASRGGTKEG